MQIKLKTDHAGSSYGLPVAVIDGQACGPADGMYGRSAADHVHDWAGRPERTAEEIDMARKFLAQWPDGPQLPEGVGGWRDKQLQEVAARMQATVEWLAQRGFPSPPEPGNWEYYAPIADHFRNNLCWLERHGYRYWDEEDANLVAEFANNLENLRHEGYTCLDEIKGAARIAESMRDCFDRIEDCVYGCPDDGVLLQLKNFADVLERNDQVGELLSGGQLEIVEETDADQT